MAADRSPDPDHRRDHRGSSGYQALRLMTSVVPEEGEKDHDARNDRCLVCRD